MRPTKATVRGIYATALRHLEDDQVPAGPRHLMRALDTAIHRRHPEADARDKRSLRHHALDGLPGWTGAVTRADLVAQLRDAARCGLDLSQMSGQPYAVVAGRVWCHGAYSASRVRSDRPAPRGASADGRPWVRLWTDDEAALNPLVLRAEFTA